MLSQASGASRGRARAGVLDRALQVGDALLAEVGQHDGVEDDRRDAGGAARRGARCSHSTASARSIVDR